jgi:N-acetylneuraminic acid mutarotase
MVVFGGIDTSSAAVNTGGRYDPATDTWAPTISTPGIAPEPRYDHVAVSTGSKLIVFGGVITPSNGRVAYTYDPSGDAWSPVSAPPISRRSCSAVWTGTELIVWGGGNSNYSNDGERYDPSSDTWSLTSTATTVPEGRHYSAAVWTGTEMIVWGGANSSPGLTAIDSGGRYMPATDSWTPTSRGAGVPAARYFHTAVWTGREMIVWGGWSSTANGSLNSGGRYDPITDRWLPTSTGANVPSARSQHKAVWTGNKMVVIGGGTGGGRYDPLTDTWLPVSLGPGAPTPGNLGTVWTGMELLAWPGGSSDGGRYDPVNDTWAAFPSGNGVVASRIEYSTVWSGSEMIVWGGSPNTNTGGRFNPLTSLWTPTSTGANVPTERLEHAAVWTGSEMIIFGGVRSGNPAPFNGGGRYVPASDSWSPVATAGAPANTPVQSAVWTGTQLIVWSGISNTNTGGLYCACPNGALFYRDADGDGFGDPGLSAPSCDGSAPAGYVDDHTDCNDAAASAYPGAAEVCNGIDDNCDGLVDEGASGIDADGDLVAGACDNCPLVANATQSDFDHDGEGDACDLNDGEIWQGRDDKTSVSWQPEEGPTAWNVYTGDLDALRSTGIYTQVPGSNALADRQCHLLSTVAAETNDPAPGKASYTLVTGVTGGVEGSLGSSSAGSRPNTNPCP